MTEKLRNKGFENKGSLDKACDLMSHILYFGTWDFRCQSFFLCTMSGQKVRYMSYQFYVFCIRVTHVQFLFDIIFHWHFSLSELDRLDALCMGC